MALSIMFQNVLPDTLILATTLLTAIGGGYLILRRIERKYDTYYIEKQLGFINQPRFIKGKYQHIQPKYNGRTI